MRIVRALKEAGSIYSSPDDRIGYGIPDMKKAFSALLTEFASSTATVDNCIVTLNWSSKDVAAMKYEIERKAPGDLTFIKIGELNPQAGNILTNHDYQSTNILSNLNAGTVSYRIRQIIDTAATSFTAIYIDTAEITISSSCTTTDTTDPNSSESSIIIAPNPPIGSTTSLIVETNDAIADMPITVYDMQGRLVLQLQRSKPAGKAIFEIPIDRLARGKYMIRVNNGRKTIGKTSLLKL